ncbi:MAG: transcription elongation factor GreA [Chloroflexota bacterium]|nr:transcription elongation factor GreA [Chloroflexota bacterium]
MNEQYLTSEGEKKLRVELEHLTGAARQNLAKRLKAAIEMGDLSENAEYISTKEEQSFLEGRIQEIEFILRNAIIIEEKPGGYDTVSLGAKVTIQEHGYPAEVYHLVGSKEANPIDGRISNESPIGQAILGKIVGDEVTIETPGGTLQLKILKIK